MIHGGKQEYGQKPGFSPPGIRVFSISASIGWGSFIVTCNTYLRKSGVPGTVFGMLPGMAVIPVITWNLQYMIRKAPGAGGVYTFEKQTGGIVIACGMARYEDGRDASVSSVFERADQVMYENKNRQKTSRTERE